MNHRMVLLLGTILLILFLIMRRGGRFAIAIGSAGNVYYVSNDGSDSHNGFSTGSAWQTVAHELPIFSPLPIHLAPPVPTR